MKPALYPHGTAIVGTIQQVGGAVGMALLVTIMTTGAAQYASDAAATVAAADLPALSLAAGMRQAFLLALGLVAIALVLALFFLKRTQPESGGEMQQVHAH